MTRNINHTYSNSMFELKFTFYGKGEKLYVQDDVDREELEFLFYCAKHYKKILCFTKKNITCPVCGKTLNNNGTTNRLWNKKIPIKLQNYYHKNCKKAKVASLEKFKDKYCCYNREIREGGTTSSLMSYKS